jgi:hypothetical protein
VNLSLAFFRGTKLSSRAIEWISAGIYSHCAAVWSPTEYLDSYEDKVGDIPPGVAIRPMSLETTPHTVMSLAVTAQQYAAWETFLRAQLGKPYDWPAIFGFGLGRNWRENDSWFCSEIQAAALEQAGICGCLPAPNNKITPMGLANIFGALGAK